MAKGRKDTGDLYEVFRKITAKQSEIPAPEPVLKDQTDKTEAPRMEDPEYVPRMVPVDKRCFYITYDTAIITFIAFILVGTLLYVTGYNLGKKSVTEENSFKDTVNIMKNTDTAIHELSLSDEKGPGMTEWTVEVYRVSRESLKDLEEKVKQKLDKQGFKTYIARSKDNTEYLLWIGKFPKGSTTAQTIMEEMMNIPTRTGKKAFKDPKFVKFDESRVLK